MAFHFEICEEETEAQIISRLTIKNKALTKENKELKKQFSLTSVSHQRELLKVLEYVRQIKGNPKEVQELVDKLYLENL